MQGMNLHVIHVYLRTISVIVTILNDALYTGDAEYMYFSVITIYPIFLEYMFGGSKCTVSHVVWHTVAMVQILY